MFDRVAQWVLGVALGMMLVLPSSVSAQELPSPALIIDQHVRALGGRTQLESIKNMMTLGTLELSGSFGKLEMESETVMEGNQRLSTLTSGDLVLREGTNGKVFWKTNSRTGAEVLKGLAKAHMKAQSQLFPSLSWGQFDGKIVVEGMERVAGQLCYRVRFDCRDGVDVTRFFHPDTGRIEKLIGKSYSNQESPSTIEVLPSDYRKVKGIWVPFRQVTVTTDPRTQEQFKVVLTVNEVRFNQKLPAGLFALPPEVEALLPK